MQFTVFQKYCVVPLKTKCLMLTKIFLKQWIRQQSQWGWWHKYS
jgi:hypothetical protein